MARTRICLTGGLASGKTTVAKMFAELGAIILDADRVARELVCPGSPCWARLQDLLGNAFFDQEGMLDRRKLRQTIIDDEKLRRQINEVLHPVIMATMQNQFENWRQISPHTPIIFDIPLLFEAGLAHQFNYIILVFAPIELQIERLMIRDKLSRQEAELTLTMQLPLEQKTRWAQKIIDNSQDLEHTRHQVVEVWDEILRNIEAER